MSIRLSSFYRRNLALTFVIKINQKRKKNGCSSENGGRRAVMLVFVSSDGKRELGHICEQGLFIHDQTDGRNQQGLSWQLFILHCCRVLRRRRQSQKLSTKSDTRRPSSQNTFKYKINESGEQFRLSGLQPFSFSDDSQFPFGHRRRRNGDRHLCAQKCQRDLEQASTRRGHLRG